VFFDAGETLVHPHPSFPDLLAAVLRREGQPVTAAAVRERAGIVFERFRRAAEANERWTTSPERSRAFWLGVYEAFLADLGIPGGDGVVERIYETFTDLANYRLFEDVPPVLERLAAAGLVLGVISNFEEWLERLLEELGVRERFSVLVISGLEGIEKPDPRIFLLAAERAGVSPQESVYVGDDPGFDVGPAAGVGMRPILIDRRGRFPGFTQAPRITTMAELPGILGL
jgi:HAD superfamily hydrolase (TIGR01549 family)